MGKKSRKSCKKNKTKVVPPAGHDRHFAGDDTTADHLSFTRNDEYYTEPLQERPMPNMMMETILQQYMPKLYESCSAAAKRHQQANQLSVALKASVLTTRSDSASVGTSMSLQEMSRHEVLFEQSVTLIQITSLTRGRVAPGLFLGPLKGIQQNMTTSQEIDSITESYPMASLTNLQLVDKLNVKGWVVLLANSIVLAFLQNRFGHAFKVVQELRAQAENGVLADLKNQQLEITVKDLRFALSITGIYAACLLYQNRDVGREQKPQAGISISAINKVPRSAFLLDAIEVLANDLVKFCPKSPVGYRWLGYVARESVAKRNWHGLKGVADCLKHMTNWYKAADAQDDDFYKALGRIEAAFCHCLGAGGVVGYEVNSKKVMVRRDFGSDRAPTNEEDLWSTDYRLSLPKETKRIRDGILATNIDPDELVFVPRSEVLRLWNEAMESYDALQKWGHHFYVFGEAKGWSDVVTYLKQTRDRGLGPWGVAMQPVDADWGFDTKRTKGYVYSQDVDCCCVCGKTDQMGGDLLMKCSRCNEATYCSRDCQAKDWKTHKKVCNKK